MDPPPKINLVTWHFRLMDLNKTLNFVLPLLEPKRNIKFELLLGFYWLLSYGGCRQTQSHRQIGEYLCVSYSRVIFPERRQNRKIRTAAGQVNK